MTNKKCTKCDTINSSLSKYCSQCGYELPKTEKTESKEILKTEKKKNKLTSIIVGFLAFGISFFGVKMLFTNSLSFDKAMMEAASEINKSCPIMVDSGTRLDNTVALPDNIFQYNYTLINLKKSEINLSELRDYIEPNIVNNVKTNPDMKDYRENRVTMAYYYKDKNGEFILKINVTPEIYE